MVSEISNSFLRSNLAEGGKKQFRLVVVALWLCWCLEVDHQRVDSFVNRLEVVSVSVIYSFVLCNVLSSVLVEALVELVLKSLSRLIAFLLGVVR